MKQRIARWCTV